MRRFLWLKEKESPEFLCFLQRLADELEREREDGGFFDYWVGPFMGLL